MASWSSNTSRNYYITLNVNERALTAENIANNQTVIDWSLYLTLGSTNYQGATTNSVYVEGDRLYGITNIGMNWYEADRYKSHLIASGSKVINHNADGTKQIHCTASWDADSGGYGPVGLRIDQYMNLTTVPRASTPTCPTTVMGQTMTISTNRASADFTHRLTYIFGSSSGEIATGVGDQASWAVPLALANQVPSAVSGTGTITCETYNGSGTLIGTSTVGFTLTVPESIVPTIGTITVDDSTGAKAWAGAYLQGHSKAQISFTGSGVYGSTISANKIEVNGQTFASNNATTNPLLTVGVNTITVTVTDSRGRVTTSSITITVVAYAYPQATSIKVERCTSGGVISDTGTYVKVTYSGSCVSVTGNTYSHVLYYRQAGATNWTNWGSIATTASFNSNVVKGTISTDYGYDFKVIVTDRLKSSEIATSIGTSFQLMDFNASGKGIAFGKVSEKDKMEFNMDAEFTGLFKTALLNFAYPIGTIYTSVVNTSPATLFGGTWVAFGTGKTIVGVDTSQTEFNTVEKTGGTKTNSFTLGLGYAQIAQGLGWIYSKERAVAQWFATKVTTNSSVVNSSDGPGIGVALGGTTDAGSILQPFITVYMWKRTA